MRCSHCGAWLGHPSPEPWPVIPFCLDCIGAVPSVVPVRTVFERVEEPEDARRQRLRLEERPWRP